MRSALCVWGGWEGHQPKACMEIQASWLREAGFEVEMSNSLEVYLNEQKLRSVHLIVQSWTMGNATKEQVNGLLTAIRAGTGFAGCHGGVLDAFRDSFDFKFMLGGQFAYHPSGCPIDFEVKVTNRKDQITAGVKDFMMHSEPYYLQIDPYIEVLAAVKFPGPSGYEWIRGREIPAAWKTSYEKGRVFCTSLGHGPADFHLPEVKQIVQRGMLWAARS